MKTIVFLWLFVSVVVLSSNTLLANESLAYERTSEGFVFTHENFTLTLDEQEMRYHVNGQAYQEGYHLVYGYVDHFKSDRLENRYDGFLLMISRNGDVVKEEIVHNSDLSEVRFAGFLEGKIYAFLDESIYTGEPYTYRHTEMLIFDYTFSLLNEKRLERRPLDVITYEDMIYVKTQYNDGFDKAFNALADELTEGVHTIESGGIYREPVTLMFTGKGVFDYKIVEAGVLVDVPGHYVLYHQGRPIHFTVGFDFTFEDNHMMDKPFTLDYTVGQVMVNNHPYAAGEVLDMPGRYTVEVSGVNGYSESKSFTLLSGLTGVYDGLSYEEARTLEFLGEGFLNDVRIMSGHEVSEPGVYTLQIYGVDDYYEVVHFTLMQEEARDFSGWIGLEIGLFSVGVCLAIYTVYAWKKKRKTYA